MNSRDAGIYEIIYSIIPGTIFPNSMTDPNLAQIFTEESRYIGQYVASVLSGIFALTVCIKISMNICASRCSNLVVHPVILLSSIQS